MRGRRPPPVAGLRLPLHPTRGGPPMLHAGLDLSRKRLDFNLRDERGALVGAGATQLDAAGLAALVQRVARHRRPVRTAIESMTGARFVHDQLERLGWEVAIADVLKAKGLAPLACKTDRIDARVLAELSRRDLVPAIWLPDPEMRAERERARFLLHLVRQRSCLKHRIHATLVAHGVPCPVSDLFGVRGRALLAESSLPEPWRSHVETPSHSSTTSTAGSHSSSANRATAFVSCYHGRRPPVSTSLASGRGAVRVDGMDCPRYTPQICVSHTG